MARMSVKNQTARTLRRVAWRLERPPKNHIGRAVRAATSGETLTPTDSAAPSRKSSWFFEQYPQFYWTSSTAPNPARLNLRYEAIFGENKDIFAGATVLDIACHDGRWSLASLATGAQSVIGIDARPELVEVATKNLEENGFGSDRVRFITGDVHEVLNTQSFKADVVLCLGFLYHTLRYNELLDGIRRTNAKYLIIDTFSPYMAEPVPSVNVMIEDDDGQGSAAAETDTYTQGSSVLIGRPNLAAIRTMVEAYGYRVERLSDWAAILRDNPEADMCGDYANGRRITVRCVSTTAAPA